VALAVILFEGGVKTRISVLRLTLWPAFALATAGVVVTALVVAGFVALFVAVSLPAALLVGAAAAPTDAAAVAALLRRSRVALPERVAAVLEVESGLNDPMSIFLTVLVLRILAEPGWATFGNAALLVLREMAGGAALGLAGGWLLGFLLRRLPLEPPLANVLALSGGLAVFGVAQMLGTSGFLAIFIAAVMAGAVPHRAHQAVEHFFEGLGWLSQIALFVMLGLLVTPHDLLPYLVPGVGAALVLIFLARPLAVIACLSPFRFGRRDIAFASWVGLRGAVPIFLSIIPALSDPNRDERFFAGIFILVVASLVIQGWTIAPAARLLGYGRAG
jgi:cell volume regulation protein A